MKSEEVDKLVVKVLDHAMCAECRDGVRNLATALKSALADTERIDWLESQVERNEPAVEWSPEFSMDKGKSLREEIDRRRVQA